PARPCQCVPTTSPSVAGGHGDNFSENGLYLVNAWITFAIRLIARIVTRVVRSHGRTNGAPASCVETASSVGAAASACASIARSPTAKSLCAKGGGCFPFTALRSVKRSLAD